MLLMALIKPHQFVLLALAAAILVVASPASLASAAREFDDDSGSTIDFADHKAWVLEGSNDPNLPSLAPIVPVPAPEKGDGGYIIPAPAPAGGTLGASDATNDDYSGGSGTPWH
ncbi:hypothetical protein H6P81_004993 [Aristolochia fimbriata]|uniref:Secreted protein n=1 Tax=Aristolochia fimbriata TaxID=158543 RepID=A0AAV7EU79_ARIFI|nr:hypothetical protein H6P81_004993 [Aristolochia fimbriata]